MKEVIAERAVNVRADFFRLMMQKGWARAGKRLIVGVSGGMDSMVLLHLVRELSREQPVRIVAAHLNHALRGRESERDEQFVREICSAWGVPVEVGREDVGALAHMRGLSIQVAAREARYAFFKEVLEKRKGHHIVLGHHADDVAETVMLRFLRGTSVHGLRGIPEHKGAVIRPLLPFTRQEIQSYAEKHRVPFVEDSSNRKTIYLRNKVRHELIPEIERHFQRAFRRHLIRYAAYFRELQDYLEGECQAIFSQMVKRDDSIDLRDFRRVPRALQRVFLERFLLRKGKGEAPLSFQQLDGLLTLIASSEGTRKMELRRDFWAVREYNRLFFTDSPVLPEIRPVVCSIPGSVELKDIHNRLEVNCPTERPPQFRSTRQEAYLDGDRLGQELWVRAFQPGDRIEMAGTVKVKKLFIDAKIPARFRRRIPLVGSGEDILWIGGIGVNRCYYVTDKTRRLVHLRFRHPLEVR